MDGGLFTNGGAAEIPALSNSGNLGRKSPSEIIQQDEHPAYFNPVVLPECPGVVGSIDMVRLEVRMNPRDFDDIQQGVETCACDRLTTYTSNKMGGYRLLYALEYAERVVKHPDGEIELVNPSTVALGLGLNKGGGIDAGRGFLEFNPNKLGDKPNFYKLRRMLDGKGCKYSMLRWDMALDLDGKRREYMLLKDRRKYEYHNGGAVTEYLGQKNRVGRVKLYDKTKESKLSRDLTRLEITCSDWLTFEKDWPKVIVTAGAGLSTGNKALTKALVRLMELGEPINPYIDELDKKTRAKIRARLEVARLGVPAPVCLKLFEQAMKWTQEGEL